MFDINTINRRHFEVKLTVEIEETGEQKEVHLLIEPPKIKTLKKMGGLTKVNKDDAMDETIEVFKKIVNKNKGKKILDDEIIDNIDLDEMKELLNAFFEWLMQEKNSKN